MPEIKLNKTELKAQKLLLGQLTKYLPTLILKKQQLQMEVDAVATIIEKKLAEMEAHSNKISPWAQMLTEASLVEVEELIQIKEVVTKEGNIAGVDIPVFLDVFFEDTKYSLFVTPSWVDTARDMLRELVSRREEIRILKEKHRLLAEELRQTKIKVNLFEKRMIPACTENIRKIKIFLGDQEIAAICNAKIAKGKLKAKDLAKREAISA
ncbi:V-type ATP synthase subunit D [Candidatus Riflebacteria bacterium]